MASNASAVEAGSFIEPMECLLTGTLPEGPGWSYELKLDGFRLQAARSGSVLSLYSRRGNLLNARFASLVDNLAPMPDGTVLDGELVALGDDGRPDFQLLQNFRSDGPRIIFFAFDILLYRHKSLLGLPLEQRREILRSVLPQCGQVRLSEAVETSAAAILHTVRDYGLEGVVAKREDSVYEPGKRTGAWLKHRINLGQEFVIGGYTPGSHGFDALVVGFYRGEDLIYASRVRAGFVPALRRQLFARLKPLVAKECPFANLPEQASGRWGQGFTAAKMRECVWLQPELVAQVEFLEWTGADHLRHTKFIGLREDKTAKDVVKETV